MRIAFQQSGNAAGRFGSGRQSADREHAGEESSGKAADSMYAKNIERVVVAQSELEPGAGPEADAAGDHTDQHALHRQYEPRSGRDGAETRHLTTPRLLFGC